MFDPESFSKALKITEGAVKEGVNTTKQMVTDMWSVMDAAAEKPAPSQYLGAVGLKAVQGVADQTQRGVKTALADS